MQKKAGNQFRLDDSPEQVIRFYSDMVYRLAFARTSNRYDADDVYEEVFLRYLKKNPKFQSEEHRRAWLIRVTINCSNTFLTSAWQRRVQELPEDHKEFNEDLLIPISLSDVEQQPAIMTAELRGFSAERDFQTTYESIVGYDSMGHRSTRVLVPQPDSGVIPLDGIEFTGIGYVDGMLHIQFAVPDHQLNDNHGYFFLVDGSGQIRRPDCEMSFWGQNNATRRIVYEDCVFTISPEELSDYTLHGYFVTTGFRMEGDWSVTFPLEKEE